MNPRRRYQKLEFDFFKALPDLLGDYRIPDQGECQDLAYEGLNLLEAEKKNGRGEDT